jgi:hypothetical protein
MNVVLGPWWARPTPTTTMPGALLPAVLLGLGVVALRPGFAVTNACKLHAILRAAPLSPAG